MKKIITTMKRKLNPAIAVVLVLCAFAFSGNVMAQSVIASGNCGASGSNLTWKLTNDGVLTISGSGKMKNYDIERADNVSFTHLGDYYGDYYAKTPWLANLSKIKTLVIGNGVTSIGEHAFENCDKLTSVTISSSVTSIGQASFNYCHSLKTITIHATTPPTLGTQVFYDVEEFTVYIPDGTYNSYSNASNWNKLRDMIELSKTASGNCGANGSNLTWKLTSDGALTISGSGKMADWGYPKDAPWKYVLRYIKTLVIGNGVTSIGDFAFKNCRSLTSITIPNSLTSIGESAFMGCVELKTITIHATTPPSLGYNAFGTVGTNNYVFGMEIYVENESIPIYIPDGTYNKYKNDGMWGSFTNFIESGNAGTSGSNRSSTSNAIDEYAEGNKAYNNKDYAKAREWFTKAANKGNADAMCKLGDLYYYGRGAATDYAKALEWYTKAADKGNADAMNGLGRLYYNGYGVTQNYTKAREWWTKAANKGNEWAKDKLKEMDTKR